MQYSLRGINVTSTYFSRYIIFYLYKKENPKEGKFLGWKIKAGGDGLGENIDGVSGRRMAGCP